MASFSFEVKGSGFGRGGLMGVNVMVLLVGLILCLGENGVTGQQLPGCVGKLIPCASYLNSTAPPESCCSPLREAFEKETSCLCGLYNSRETFLPLGLNITQILELPSRCGINYNLNVCNSPAPTSSPTSAAELGRETGLSPASAPSPVAVAGGSMARVGMAGLMGMILLASMIV